MMKRDLENPSREGRRWLRDLFRVYGVRDFLALSDAEMLERGVLDVIRAERGIALRLPRERRRRGAEPGAK